MLERLRLWALKKLFNDSEKYLIARAIDDRKEKLEESLHKRKSMDYDNGVDDIQEYNKLKRIFTTNLWN